MIARGTKIWTTYACAAWVCCAAGQAVAPSIQGVVHDQTSHRLAVGDEVILLRESQSSATGQRIQEEAHTKTDAGGAFTLTPTSPNAPRLVRVVHQGVNYDRRATVGDTISVDVFDAAAKVRGLTGSIEILRLSADKDRLYVSDMIEIVNDSSPPLTQTGERSFDVFLPADAIIDPTVAAGPDGGLPPGVGATRLLSPTAVPGEPQHYTVDFPLRPGATQFIYKYTLPYNGHLTLHPRSVYPVQQFAVTFPTTMKFTSPSSAFQVLQTGNGGYQAEASEHVPAGARPAFEISGTGKLPSLLTPAQAPPRVEDGKKNVPAASQPSGSTNVSPGSLPWVLGVGALLLLAGCGFLMSRSRRTSAYTTATQERERQNEPIAGAGSAALEIEALKNDLFQLEVGRLQGIISAEEHASTKRSLETTMQRIWARSGAVEKQDTPNQS